MITKIVAFTEARINLVDSGIVVAAICVLIDRFIQNRSRNVVYLLIVLEPGTPAS